MSASTLGWEEDGLVVAVVGATGAVGRTLLDVLAERDFPVGEMRLLGSARSAGSSLEYSRRTLPVEEGRAEAFDGADLVFLAGADALARELAPEAVRRGALAIDLSAAWRLDQKVPLVVPEINGRLLDADGVGIVACPNCTTIGLVMALEPLRRTAGLRSVVVTTLQAAGGAGRRGIEELQAQLADPAAPAEVFPRRLAGDVLPHCEDFREDGYTSEERKLLDETRKILGLPELQVSMTCVRVPVAIGHSAAVLVETEEPLDPASARAVLDAFPGVRVLDDPAAGLYPTVRDALGADDVLVGRVRADPADPRKLWLWQVSDNTRKGASLNAVQSAERLFT